MQGRCGRMGLHMPKRHHHHTSHSRHCLGLRAVGSASPTHCAQCRPHLRVIHCCPPQLPTSPTWKGLVCPAQGSSRVMSSHRMMPMAYTSCGQEPTQNGLCCKAHRAWRACSHAPGKALQAGTLTHQCAWLRRTEAKVALPPCSTSGLSQRGLVAAMLVPESRSVPSMTCAGGKAGKSNCYTLVLSMLARSGRQQAHSARHLFPPLQGCSLQSWRASLGEHQEQRHM